MYPIMKSHRFIKTGTGAENFYTPEDQFNRQIIYTHMSIINNTSSMGNVTLEIINGVSEYFFKSWDNPVPDKVCSWDGDVVLSAGCRFKVSVTTGTSGDFIDVVLFGFIQ